jgi:heavy metal translocating P-type ATPase
LSAWFQRHSDVLIAGLAILAIGLHLMLWLSGVGDPQLQNAPLYVALTLGGLPLVGQLLVKLFQREFGSDLLAGISIVTAILLGEYLAGTLVVLMLSGGAALESYAVSSASQVLQALARRMPNIAHKKGNSGLVDVPLEQIEPGDLITIFPHEVSPVDGVVVEGRGMMDESYLTGEPYQVAKTPGVQVLSGAINGEAALTIRAEKRASDSRYSQIVQVMQSSQQQRTRIRRLGDQLGAFYTPLAVSIALLAWGLSGEPIRFLAVLVVATPCPLLIAIPVAIIGSISLAAQRAIVVRDPSVLEQADTCRTMIFDKTGTLTYGKPQLTEQLVAAGYEPQTVLALAAGVERYSKHPLAEAIVEAAQREQLAVEEAAEVIEKPGQGLVGTISGSEVRITGRKDFLRQFPDRAELLPPQASGLECIVLLNQQYAATYRFRDAPRREGAPFIGHLYPSHGIDRVLMVSGDRESEVRYLAELVGVTELHAEKTPEEKLTIVRAETSRAHTIYVGDGINDAPALLAATVGLAFGQNSDVTTEAAGAVILDSSLQKVDELLHISRRMRTIALQSAVGGMAVSVLAMGFAAIGWLPPVAGAVTQEIIDLVAVANALRAAFPPRDLSDF